MPNMPLVYNMPGTKNKEELLRYLGLLFELAKLLALVIVPNHLLLLQKKA